ncbi:AraC-like DNA-binding protein [Hoeflea marina]|uniref:AraC-like DNA-binding protein n=1 Tax=Hoeflea marina TaxID=274592 RepID=A0A317PGH2_9HYPH|nr:helix-turn-helix domain-containing protein [Hoeflea marina]PWV99046.1 AraC-like DNA-binding protein [Hoeflea marina]
MIRDAAHQTALQPWVPMDCHQLSSGDRVGQVDILELGAERLVRERQDAAVQKLGIMPAGLCTISLSRIPNVRFSEILETDDQSVFFLPENTEFDVHVPCGIETAYVSFNQDDFLRAARILDPDGWETAPRQLTWLQTPRKAALWAAIDQWFRLAAGEAAPPAGVLQKALFETVLQVATAVPLNCASDPSASTRRRAMGIARAASAFIEGRLAEDHLPSIIDICQELRVSRRALQYAFLDYAGLTPLEYLRRVRLNGARKLLRESGPQSITVTEAAMRFGFLHLGRFALDYKALFGESPSTTRTA